ncbi:MAG: DUF4286 family protein [Prevotella sp.]|nr:DUF4286 family protein [Prevotella sp.]MCM1075317.1 DUF4286 family protein [Ruminococcus sp.]
MHIHNTTFVCSERDLPKLLGLLRGEIIPMLLESGHAQRPRLSRVASALPQGQESESISLQFEFDTPKAYAEWKRTHLPGVEKKLNDTFGEKVLLFSTLLQALPHE